MLVNNKPTPLNSDGSVFLFMENLTPFSRESSFRNNIKIKDYSDVDPYGEEIWDDEEKNDLDDISYDLESLPISLEILSKALLYSS